jgi:hypothetical protein
MQETVYYLEVSADHGITIHRGSKTGLVIATGVLCREKEGVTQVQFPGAATSIDLQHVSHDIFSHGKTGFTYADKKYHWKGHTGLVDDETDKLLAIFHSSWFDRNYSKVGKLEVTSDGQKVLDVAVITALIVQERSDEEKQMVTL